MKTLIHAAIRCSFIFAAVAALSVAQSAKANLITNPGFETGDFTGWTAFAGTGAAPTVAGTFNGVAPHSGNFQAVYPVNPDNPEFLNQSVATTPGASYTLDFFLASTGGGGEQFIVWFDGVGVLTLSQSVFGYTHYTFTVTASTASSFLEFNAGGVSEGAWLLDDVSLNPVGVGVPDGGSTVSLLGFGLLGLAALRRKLSC